MTARLQPEEIIQFAMDETRSVAHLHESFGTAQISRCCGGQLFCPECALNLTFRMGPGCPDLEPVAADLELVDRVATGKKPMASVVLSGKSDQDTAALESKLESTGLKFWPRVNKYHVTECVVCSDVTIGELVNLETLQRMYRHCGLDSTADTMLAYRGVKLIELLEGGLEQLDADKQFWLVGILYGYPVWSTVSLYLRNGNANQPCCGSKRERNDSGTEELRDAVEALVQTHQSDGVTVVTVLRIMRNVLQHPAQLDKYGVLKRAKPKVDCLVQLPRVMAVLQIAQFELDSERLWLAPEKFDADLVQRIVTEIEAELNLCNLCS